MIECMHRRTPDIKARHTRHLQSPRTLAPGLSAPLPRPHGEGSNARHVPQPLSWQPVLGGDFAAPPLRLDDVEQPSPVYACARVYLHVRIHVCMNANAYARLRREVVRCLSIVASSSGKAASVLAHTHAPLILALCSVSCPTHENLALSLASEKEEGAEGGTASTASALDEEAAFWALGTLSVLLASASARALSLSQFHSILHFGLSSLSQSVRGICG